MNLLLLQTKIVWCNPQDNCSNIEALIDSKISSGEHLGNKSDVDLIVLPEMFSTGFITNPKGYAEKDNYSLEWMKKVALKHNCAVCGSVATEICNNNLSQFVNRMYFVYPSGDYLFYDKRHLFSYGGEQKHFTPGGKRVVAEWRGWRFLLQICYDLRFPNFSRNHTINKLDGTSSVTTEYDAAIYVASWPSSRIAVWDTLLKARAIENQCYTIGVNIVGECNNTLYSGNSAVIDYKGNILIACSSDGKEEATFVFLDKEQLSKFLEKFPTLPDGD